MCRIPLKLTPKVPAEEKGGTFFPKKIRKVEEKFGFAMFWWQKKKVLVFNSRAEWLWSCCELFGRPELLKKHTKSLGLVTSE